MRFAYADPPYLGMCGSYGHDHGDDGLCWNDPDTHRGLIARLTSDFPDGWALSLHTPSLRTILSLCEENVRVGAWVKPFASFKLGVNPAYAWEPVIFTGGRSWADRGGKEGVTTRDWTAHVITLERGFFGAKPEAFCRWVLDLLGYVQGDELTDLFPGTGVMGRVLAQGRLAV